MHVAIIGAGYAGMAAAAELAARGVRVSVFEASRTLGGRARRVEAHGHPLDNGQHILVGAYAELLRLMRLVGADPQALLERLPLSLLYPGRMALRAPRLPAPLHLAAALFAAKGLSFGARLAAVGFMRRSCRSRRSSSRASRSTRWVSSWPSSLWMWSYGMPPTATSTRSARRPPAISRSRGISCW